MDFLIDTSFRSDLFSDDIVGSLLHLLSIADIKNFSLSCKAFRIAAKHQIRSLTPLHLPDVWSPSDVWSSLEHLQLNLSRNSRDRQDESNANTIPFSWLAPIRQLGGFQCFCHAAHVDLSGQNVPAYAIQLLSQHLTRLTSLKLDACKLPMASILDVTGLTNVRCLSLSSIQLQGSLPAQGTAEGNSGADQATAAAVPTVPAHAPSSYAIVSQQQASRLLDAICQLQQLQELWLGIAIEPQKLFTQVGPYSSAWQGMPVLQHVTKLAALRNLRVLSLVNNEITGDDWEALCASIGPHLKELHFRWGPLDPRNGRLQDLDADSFSHISRLTSLERLTLDTAASPKFEPYSLGSLANTLTQLKLTGAANIPLMLSVAACSAVVSLELSGLKAAALNELLVQIIINMPKLQCLKLSRLQPPDNGQAGLQPMGDYLLSQLDIHCAHLTELVMSDVDVTGTGLRLVATASTLATSTSASAAAGGIRSCKHLELFATHMMRSAFPHLSALTSLESLVFHGMAQKQFPHLCRLNCLNSLTALTNLTTFRVLPILDELAMQHMRFEAEHDIAALAAGAAAGGAGGVAAAAAAAVHASDDESDDDDDFSSDDESSESEEDSEEDEQQQQQQPPNLNWQGPQPPDDMFNDDDDDPQLAIGLAANQAAANQAVQALAQELQQQADILANNPAQAVLAGGAFQQVVQMVIPQPLQGWQGPGANAANAAVAAVQAAAAQLAQGAAPMPPGPGAFAALHDALQAAAAAAGGGGQQPQPQQPAIPYAGVYGLRHHPFEPHLHFLGSMTRLVNVELSCLQTTGLCFLHLSNLQSLRSLALGGNITLSDDSWAVMSQLHLPGVTTLSLTGCRVGKTAAAAAAAAAAASLRGAANGSSTSAATAGPSCSGGTTDNHLHKDGANSSSSSVVTDLQDLAGFRAMDRLMQAVHYSFPGVVNLELGSCRYLTHDGLVQLATGLQQLGRLRLLGVPGLMLRVDPGSAAAGAAAAAGSSASRLGGSSNRSKREERLHQVAAPGSERLTEGMQYNAKGVLIRSLVDTDCAMSHISDAAESGAAAVDLKYVEIRESEMPRGVIEAAAGLRNVARFATLTLTNVRFGGRLEPCFF